MSGFLYIVPGLGQPTTELVAGVLPHVGGIQRNQVFRTPDGAAGWVFNRSGDEKQPGYYPGEQEWRCCDGGKLWVGWWKENPPTPAELQRERLIEGKEVAIGPHTWQMPRLRSFPWVWAWNSAGEMVEEIAEAYRGLYHDAQAALSDYTGEGVTFTRMLDLVVRALAMNYRISKAEFVALGGVGAAEVNAGFDVLTQYDEWLAVREAEANAEKKTDPASIPG